MPIAWLPYFADGRSVGEAQDRVPRRRTSAIRSRVGASSRRPYFWALAPNYDVTVTPTVFSRQGLLADVEWRHRLENGQYSLRGAGIYQLDPPRSPDRPATARLRGGVRTTGEFALNQDWTLGWDGTLSLRPRLHPRLQGAQQRDRRKPFRPLTSDRPARSQLLRGARLLFPDPDRRTAAGPQYDQDRQGLSRRSIDYHRVSTDDRARRRAVVHVEHRRTWCAPPTIRSRSPATRAAVLSRHRRRHGARHQGDRLAAADHRPDGPGDHAVRLAARRRVLHRSARRGSDRRRPRPRTARRSASCRRSASNGACRSSPPTAARRTSSSRWRRSSRARTRWAPARCPTTTRRAWCSTCRTSSTATSSPASTASRAARAPTSASATTAPSPTALDRRPVRPVDPARRRRTPSPPITVSNVGAYSGPRDDVLRLRRRRGASIPAPARASRPAAASTTQTFNINRAEVAGDDRARPGHGFGGLPLPPQQSRTTAMTTPALGRARRRRRSTSPRTGAPSAR